MNCTDLERIAPDDRASEALYGGFQPGLGFAGHRVRAGLTPADDAFVGLDFDENIFLPAAAC